MTASPRLSLEIDQEAGAAYLQFNEEPVVRSVELSDCIVVDLDAHDVGVGVEILDLAKSVPLDALTDRFHIRTESLAVLMQALRSSTTSQRVGMAAPAQCFGVLTAQAATSVVTPC